MPDLADQRVGVYGRVSTPGQDATPQLVRVREWAPAARLTVHMERVDVASGKLVRRPGQEEIMQAARGHHIHAVAVSKVDRWARSIQHLSSTVNELHALGVDFYAVDQGLAVRPKDPTSKLILNVLGAVAEWEASIISERTKDSLAAKKAAGVVGGRKTGARRCRDYPGCLRLVNHAGDHRVKGITGAKEEIPPISGGSVNDRLTRVTK